MRPGRRRDEEKAERGDREHAETDAIGAAFEWLEATVRRLGPCLVVASVRVSG
jgi:hypothetical protein